MTGPLHLPAVAASFPSCVNTHIHCAGCGYDLMGVRELRCPECGRGFGVLDRFVHETFLSPTNSDCIAPWMKLVPRRLRRILH